MEESFPFFYSDWLQWHLSSWMRILRKCFSVFYHRLELELGSHIHLLGHRLHFLLVIQLEASRMLQNFRTLLILELNWENSPKYGEERNSRSRNVRARTKRMLNIHTKPNNAPNPSQYQYAWGKNPRDLITKTPNSVPFIIFEIQKENHSQLTQLVWKTWWKFTVHVLFYCYAIPKRTG